MKVIEPGHIYDLNWLDGDPHTDGEVDFPENRLVFVLREGEKYPGNIGSHPGTNIQEVLRALIDRVKYLDGQIRCIENLQTIAELRGALWYLERRAAMRHGRNFVKLVYEYPNGIENEPTCQKCRHIGCEGQCHP